MNIQLSTGKTITISSYEYFFILKDEEIDIFYQSCIADDLGMHIDDPFSNVSAYGRLEVDDNSEE